MKFNDLINEEEYVDIHKVNFKQMYDEFNRKYFENKLPNIPILIKPLKGVGARVIVTGIRSKNTVLSIDRMEISSFLKSSLERYNGLILHEMIHVYISHVLGRFLDFGDPSHGVYFKEKLKELNSKTPFEIPLLDELDSREVSALVKNKKLYIIIRKDSTKVNNLNFVLYSKALSDKDLNYFKSITFENKNITFEYYETYERSLLIYPTKTKLGTGRFGYYEMNSELYDLIKKNGKPLEPIIPYPNLNQYLRLSDEEKKKYNI
jgi:hypothetical protein